ncbi:MAG TPA: UDP-galactose-lipid carrier transferase [Acidimicrobiales bacterium]|nr:UDP-galactose-lipid carrier transferase [Acidimicrobiales bacterium]
MTAGRSRPGPRLAGVDLSGRLSADDEAMQLAAAQRRLLHLRLVNAGLVPPGTEGGGPGGKLPQYERLGAAHPASGRLGPPVCVVFEGWDASGKGGAIKRLVAPLDPRHVRVAEFGAPTPDALRHHYLWRFYPALPGWGGMAVLDRSWYGRVLVERVERLATEKQWRRAYTEITDFERSLVAEGMVLVKLWLQISEKEQLKRFEARQQDPLKQWKLTDEDWRNRGRRAEYEDAVEDMLVETDHPAAPWDVVPAEQKRFGRVAVLRTVIARMEDGMRRWGIEPPPSTGADYGT